MKNFFFTILFFLSFQWAGAQEREILGRLIDKETLQPIGNANVIIPGTLIGTTSNVAGFFKLFVLQNQTGITVSKIGYKTTNVPLSEAATKFQVKIERGTVELELLDLAFFEANKFGSPSDTSQYVIAPNQTERDAQYRGGWKQFYKDVDEIFNREDVLRGLGDSLCLVYFTVENSGAFSFAGTKPENQLINELMNKSTDDFAKWSAAKQNGIPVSQHFALPVKFTEVFLPVEETATPMGGLPAFYRFVGENMRYPADARRHGIQGKVIVQFIIEKDGRITNPIIIQGIGGGCDEEALRVMSQTPKWNPGRQKGKPVRQRYTLPMIFKLG